MDKTYFIIWDKRNKEILNHESNHFLPVYEKRYEAMRMIHNMEREKDFIIKEIKFKEVKSQNI